ncbi:MAG: hypothetical protein M1833_003837 [Piccolia ochrophora]|nr:MAG: hypothetical protein M1833_003837 [Piccolia ochrophora]
MPDESPPRTPHELEQEREAGSSIARPAFAPFFTLIEDVVNQQHHHPSVHYIFADDDPHLITQASLRALSPGSLGGGHSPRERESTGAPSEDGSSGGLPTRPGVTERYVVLDVGDSGEVVRTAQSLTSDWHVLEVDVSSAPTWGPEEGSAVGGTGGLMLKIQGTGVDPLTGISFDKDEDGELEVKRLVRKFDARMETLRKVMEAGHRVADQAQASA